MSDFRKNRSGRGNAWKRQPSVGWVLASLALCMLLPSLGTSIANVALPTLAEAFAASFQQVQWVVLAYLLATTTSIVSVGRLGDIIGRRRLLIAGIVLFTAASGLCGVASGLWLLIAARAAQGLGAAVMMALTMAFVGEAVPKPRTGSAMGLLGTMSAVGTALGPSLGGVLIAGFGWQAIFLVNLPLGLLALVLARGACPPIAATPAAARTSFDLCGHAAAGADARGLRARDDDRARPVRAGQHRAAGGRGTRRCAVRAGRSTSGVAVDPVDEVSRSGAEREPGDECARLDGDDGDAGGRAVLSRSCARPRPGACRHRHVGGTGGRRADRRARRTHRRPLRRAPHDRQRARRDGGRVLGCWPGRRPRSGIAGYVDPHRRHHRRLRALPDGQQHRRDGGCLCRTSAASFPECSTCRATSA